MNKALQELINEYNLGAKIDFLLKNALKKQNTKLREARDILLSRFMYGR